MVAIACSLALALSFAASLSAIPPVLSVFVSDQEGPRAAVFKKAADRALGVELKAYRSDKHGKVTADIPASSLVIDRIADDSLVGEFSVGASRRAGTVPVLHAVIYPSDVTIATRGEFLESLARAEDGIEVRVIAGQRDAAETITLRHRSASLLDHIIIGGLRFAGGLLPKDTSVRATQKALLIVLTCIFLLVLFTAVCRFVAQYLIIIASNRAVMDMRRHMYHTIMHLPVTWFGRHMSETMSRIVTDYRDVERGYRALFGKLTTEPIKVAVLLVAAVVLDWRVTVFAMIAAPLGAVIVTTLGRKIRKSNRRLLTGYAQLMGVINATLSGIKVVRAYNNQHYERRRMWTADRKLLKQLLRIGRLESMIGPLLELLGVGVAMGGVVWLADYVFSGELKPEEFFGLVVFMVAIFDSIRKISAVYPRLARADGAAQRVFELIDMPIEQRKDKRFAILPPLKQSIRFEDVSFTYPESERPALRNVSLEVQKGQTVALVGPNGSGKTTLIGLLERFSEPDSGRILIDGRDITEFSMQSLRRQISLITQDAVIFAVSAFDNIAYGMSGATKEQVESAARQAHAHEFIERLPQGYDTVLGEFGATISGGEKQRLALARAILRDAPIFIFDEATSQIDVDSEKKIHEAIRQFMEQRTSLIIAHRIATITDADRIAVFDQGRLIDTGDHTTLLERCELYATLYHAHSGSSQ